MFFPKQCSHFQHYCMSLCEYSISDTNDLANQVFYHMVQLKSVPKSAEDFVPLHRRLPVEGFHSPGESITLYSKRKCIFDLIIWIHF